VFGFYWVIYGPVAGVTYRAIEGISVFAVLYVIAQGSERAVELVTDVLSLIPESPEERKTKAVAAVRKANSTLNGNPLRLDLLSKIVDDSGTRELVEKAAKASEQKADKKTEADDARRDITFLAHGLSIAICAVAVNGLNYGVLSRVGADGVSAGLDRLLTMLAAAGGTKALHELISRVQASKESAEEGEKA
jgi:hypothetical protein